MERRSSRIFGRSNEDVRKDGVKKSQTERDRNRGVEISKILARQSENLRDKETTTAVSLLDAVGDPHSMLGYLVRRGLCLKKEQITKAYSEARGLMWQA